VIGEKVQKGPGAGRHKVLRYAAVSDHRQAVLKEKGTRAQKSAPEGEKRKPILKPWHERNLRQRPNKNPRSLLPPFISKLSR